MLRICGKCRSCNKAYRKSAGKYLIDLAADEELLAGRRRQEWRFMEKSGPGVGVHFCDAALMDDDGNFLKTHYPRDNQWETP
ncbi:MAG: hypothetical protein U5K79_03325 [Cyclobacteriaceae bacterium]|nr:hypothetical protein [Cyclobacteriaceae bacterium]